MPISHNTPLGTPSTSNKANALLNGLSANIGSATGFAPDFSEMLKSTFTPPMVTPPQFSEPAPKADALRAPEQAQSSQQGSVPDQSSGATKANTPNQVQAKGPTTPKQEQAKNSTSSSQDIDQTGGTKASEDSSDAQTSAQASTSEASQAKKDKPVDQSAEAADAAGLNVAAIATSMNDPKSALSADAQKPLGKADKLASDAAGPQDLASLMPSVAKAVFGQDAGKQSVGDGKSDRKVVPTSTDERGKIMSAKAQDTAAQLAAQPTATDNLQKDMSAMSSELVKSFAFDKTSSGDQPSFGKMMQAVGSVTGPLTGPFSAMASGSQASATSTAVQVKSDLFGPAFAPEMAARLTVLTGAGVQKAELHLNPADMGPVSVHIHMNGQEAQVNFHAQHAVTREVLERSLPELAAALRDAGMTLTGGGVFQQSNGARQDGQAQGTQVAGQGLVTSGSDLGGPVTAPMTVRHTQVGVLDMYA